MTAPPVVGFLSFLLVLFYLAFGYGTVAAAIYVGTRFDDRMGGPGLLLAFLLWPLAWVFVALVIAVVVVVDESVGDIRPFQWAARLGEKHEKARREAQG